VFPFLSLSLSHETLSCGGTVGFTHITRALTRRHAKSRPRQTQTRDRESVKFSGWTCSRILYTRASVSVPYIRAAYTRRPLGYGTADMASLSFALLSRARNVARNEDEALEMPRYIFLSNPGRMGSLPLTIELQKLLRFPLSPATSLSASSSVLFLLRSFARDPTAFFPSPLDRPSLFLYVALRVIARRARAGRCFERADFAAERSAFGDICYFREDPPAPGAIMKVLIKKCLQSVSSQRRGFVREGAAVPGFPD